MGKKIKKWVCVALAVMLLGSLFGCTVSQKDNAVNKPYTLDQNAVQHDEETGVNYVNNIIIIYFEDDVTEARKNEIIQSIGGKIVGSFNSINQYQVEVIARSLVELDALAEQLMGYEEIWQAHSDIAKKIAPGKLVERTTPVTPNDPWRTDKTSENWNEASPSGNNWWAEAIYLPSAWAYNDELTRIDIGIVDNGFDTGHEDLKIQFPNKASKTMNNKEDHGTHVAGIIGATHDNRKGIAGIIKNVNLYCSDWVPTKRQQFFVDWDTETMLLAGLIYTVEAGAKVVNFSTWCSGGLESYMDTQPEEERNREGTSISSVMASLLRNYDFVVVQSSGNGAPDINNKKVMIGVDVANDGLFASITRDNCVFNSKVSIDDILDRIILVAAAERQDGSYRLTSYSNWGEAISIAAPGGSSAEQIYSTVAGGWHGAYGEMSGTSMAAPMVTGVAGLVWAANSKLKGAEVKEIVCNSYDKDLLVQYSPRTMDLKSDYHLLNAKLAVEEALKRIQDMAIDLSAEPSMVTINQTEIISESKATPATENNLSADEIYKAYLLLDKWKSLDSFSSEMKIDDKIFADLDFDGVNELLISASDAGDDFGTIQNASALLTIVNGKVVCVLTTWQLSSASRSNWLAIMLDNQTNEPVLAEIVFINGGYYGSRLTIYDFANGKASERISFVDMSYFAEEMKSETSLIYPSFDEDRVQYYMIDDIYVTDIDYEEQRERYSYISRD